MRTLLLVIGLATSAHANRAVMEQLAASNNAIFVDTINARVGISTATPATTLDVAGTAQFGTTTKSTFSTTGALTMASGAALTLSGAAGTIVAQSSITGTHFGNGANLTSITAANISAGTATGLNITGNAATVTTNANLTGGVTSVGNAATVVTNANLTGNVTSVGNATTIAVIPAVSGAALTSLTPGNISNGGLPVGVTVSTSNIVPAFNGASNLVQMGSDGKLPVIDGSKLTGVVSAQTYASTTTYPNGAQTQTNMGPCVSGSTATWTNAGSNRVMLCLAGGISATSTARAQVNFVLDGAYLPGFSSTLGIQSDPVTGGNMNMSFCALSGVLSVASHNVCLTMGATDGGGQTLTIPAHGGTPNSMAQISVKEMP